MQGGSEMSVSPPQRVQCCLLGLIPLHNIKNASDPERPKAWQREKGRQAADTELLRVSAIMPASNLTEELKTQLSLEALQWFLLPEV